jgi:putative intracellular protease/amidase
MHDLTRRFTDDAEAQALLAAAPSLTSIILNGAIREYACLYLVGGHGCVMDFPGNGDIKKAVEIVYSENGGCIAAICHGPLGLAHCEYNGGNLLKGKFISAFSNEEEAELGLLGKVTTLTETLVDSVGAICVPGPPWLVVISSLVAFSRKRMPLLA